MNYNVYFEMLSIYDDIKQMLIQRGEYTKERQDVLDNKIINAKREYRAWLKKKNAKKYLYPNNYGEIIAIGGYYDSVWRKVFFPNERWTEEEKQKFIEDNWVSYRPTYYDCTGQIFTCWIKVFNLPHGVVVYIEEAIDV